MQKTAQFDDRIRNLLALAEDDSEESRTLLFSHICDLFLQKRHMESENQINMLTEILNELITGVDISIRKELRNILLQLDNPPEVLVKLISEDVVEVSGKLLENSIIDDEQLIHLIRYASDKHREIISQRFGLSRLVRKELDEYNKKAEEERKQAEALEKKISLQELENAEQDSNILDENATASLLERLRITRNNKEKHTEALDEHSDEKQIQDVIDTDNDIPLVPDNDQSMSLTSKVLNLPDEETTAQSHDDHNDGIFDLPAIDEVNTEEIEIKITEDSQDAELLLDNYIPPEIPQGQDAILKDASEWYWEIDRNGNIQYLSENSIGVFLKDPFSMVGEDFLALWDYEGNSNNDSVEFITLFERRLAFREKAFSIKGQTGKRHHYLLSAIATFDQETGRFTGFRGSANLNRDIKIEDNDPFPQISDNRKNEESHQPQFSGNINDNPEENEKNDNTESKSSNDNQDEVASEMLHNLSHEFRTPLNAIIGFSQMIDNEMWGPVSDKYKNNTKNIINAANQLKEAINNILDSAKIEAGLIEPDPTSFSLKSVIQESIEAVSPILESKEIEVTGIDDNIDVILYNDKHCIILCLIKMITFATKNAELGSELPISVLVNSNAEVRIEIPLINEDIKKKDSDKLFEKMQNPKDHLSKLDIKHSEFEAKISSGFGLSVAQEIAKIVGGNISTLSKKKKITHIVLTISTYPI